MAKRNSLLLVIALTSAILLILSFAAVTCYASVMGIDFGVDSIKISAPKNNNMEIVLNEQSHRKSWSAVGFRGDERYFADEAKNLAARFPDNMFLGVSRLVGILHNDTETLDWFKNKMNYKVNLEQFEGFLMEKPKTASSSSAKTTTSTEESKSEDSSSDSESSTSTETEKNTEKEKEKTDEDEPEMMKVPYGTDGTLQFRTGSNPNVAYSAEVLMGMIFTYIRETVQKDAKLRITDAVVTVPGYYNDRQRQATIDAAELAGLRVISLAHPTTVAALQYGMNRRGFGNETVTILVLDVGAAHADVGVYTFAPTPIPEGKGGKKSRGKVRNAEALGTVYTRSLISTKDIGGRKFDTCLAQYIEDKFMESTKGKFPRPLGGETLAQRKSVISLMRAASKAKEMLSANRGAPIIVEGIAPQQDFPITIKREEFEQQCGHLFIQVTELVQEAARRAGITDLTSSEELNAFELFGAATRIPKIVDDLSKLRGKTVDRTLNTDEAAALGAGFYAGSLAGRFRIKSLAVAENLGVRDHPSLERNITFLLTPKPGTDKPVTYRTLYSSDSRYGSGKSVTVNRNEESFGMFLYQSVGTLPEYAADENKLPGGKVLNHEDTRTLDRLINITGIQTGLESIYYYYATGSSSSSDSTADSSSEETIAKPKKQLRHPNNTHSIRVDFRLSESGLVEVEKAELRITYMQNVTKKIKTNLTQEEVDEGKEKAKQRVLEADEVRKAKIANETAAKAKAKAENESSSSEEATAEAAKDDNKESEETEAKKDESSSTDDETNNSTATDDDSSSSSNETEHDNNNNTSSKKNKNKKKKKTPPVRNETEILERKIRIAQNAVRTYRLDSTIVLEARRRSVPLQVLTAYNFPTPYTPADKSAAKKILRVLDDIDQVKRETAAAKNDLEGYIVWVKNEGIFENADLIKLGLFTEEVEKEVRDAITKASDWLEDEGYGDDVPKKMYVDKLKELHTTTGPVLSKFTELTKPKKKKSSSSKKKSSSSSSSSNKDTEEDSKEEDSSDSNNNDKKTTEEEEGSGGNTNKQDAEDYTSSSNDDDKKNDDDDENSGEKQESEGKDL